MSNLYFIIYKNTYILYCFIIRCFYFNWNNTINGLTCDGIFNISIGCLIVLIVEFYDYRRSDIGIANQIYGFECYKIIFIFYPLRILCIPTTLPNIILDVGSRINIPVVIIVLAFNHKKNSINFFIVNCYYLKWCISRNWTTI